MIFEQFFISIKIATQGPHAIHYCCSEVISVLLLLNLSDSDDPIKVSQDSGDTGGRKAQSRSQSVPLEANIIQRSLLSAAAPLVSTGVAFPVEESPRSAQESQSGEESGAYSEDTFPVSFFMLLTNNFFFSYPWMKFCHSARCLQGLSFCAIKGLF